MEYSFGDWVKRRRKALDLTQHELANRVGCSVSLIFKIESDERRPSRQVAKLLAEHLEIPSDQQSLFLKIARQEKAVNRLASLSLEDSPSPVPSDFVAPVVGSELPMSLTPLIGRDHELRQHDTRNLVDDPAIGQTKWPKLKQDQQTQADHQGWQHNRDVECRVQ